MQLLWYDGPASITDDELKAYKTYSVGLGMNFELLSDMVAITNLLIP